MTQEADVSVVVERSLAAAPTAAIRQTYAAGGYWDERYRAKECLFDWFFNYGALRPLILSHLTEWKHLPCLHVGCGNSNIQEGMASDGFIEVMNVDISHVVIDQMIARHASISALGYQVCDCRSMPEFKTGYFGSVIDKGTMDAVLCANNGQQDTFRYLREVNRLLVEGGTFFLISLGSPTGRLEVFSKAGLNWDVEVILMPKPVMYLKSESSLTGRPISSSNTKDKDDPVVPIGPFLFATYDANNVISTEEQHLLQPQDTQQQHLKNYLENREKAAAAGIVAAHMMEGFEPKDHFYLYVCKKHIEGRNSVDFLANVMAANRGSPPPPQRVGEEEACLGKVNVRSMSAQVSVEGSEPVVVPMDPSMAAGLLPVPSHRSIGSRSSIVTTSDAAIAAQLEAIGLDPMADPGLNTRNAAPSSESVVVSHRLSDAGDSEG